MNACEEISDSIPPDPDGDPRNPGSPQYPQPGHRINNYQPGVQSWTERCAAAHAQLIQPYNCYGTQQIGDQRQAHRNEFESITGCAPEPLLKPTAHSGGDRPQHECADNYSEARADGREYEAPILAPWNSNKIDGRNSESHLGRSAHLIHFERRLDGTIGRIEHLGCQITPHAVADAR